jgi:hypothetical protein
MGAGNSCYFYMLINAFFYAEDLQRTYSQYNTTH